MKNYVQKGENLTIPAPYTVTSGGFLKSGLIFGVASGDALTGADVDVVTVGVFELPKVSTDVFAVGAAVYWDNTAKLMTSTTTSNTKIGVAVKAAANPSGSVNVRLNGTF
jgi:predicted RecA/RadA family phage recombinase